MKFHKAFSLFVICICLLSLYISSAQDANNCAAIVHAALAMVDELCSATARNQACYGNLMLEADPQPNVTDLKFDSPGDITDVTDIRALRLSALDETSQEWGVSLLRLQATLPDTLPGQNVTMLLFGNVEILPADTPTELELTVSASGAINVRGGPSTNDPIVGSLAPGASVTTNGKNAAGSWLRVLLQDNQVGWVSAQLVNSDDDLTTLHVVTTDEPFYRPMQAFYLKTGAGDAPCAEAPDSGVLIQTPNGAGKIDFRVNEVNIRLGSTAYLQAQANGVLTVSVVEGQASVEALGETQTIPEGAQVEVPLDENLSASGPPSEPEPYAQADVLPLPVSLLPEDITVAEPLTEDEIAEFTTKLNACRVVSPTNVNLRSGPGTNYLILDSITIVKGQPRFQAIGIDGVVWYSLGANLWVRSDIVEATGDCASVPILSVLPATPTPVITSGGGGSGGFTTIFFTPSCSPSTFKAGTITFAFGKGDPNWATCENVFANIGQYGFASFSGNGPAPYSYRYQQGCHGGSPEGTNTFADVDLSPGVYTYTGEWTGVTITCTITVVP